MNIRQKLISITLALGAAFAVPQFAHATVNGGSVDTTSTTLSAAVSAPVNGRGQQWCLASATNVNVPSISQAGSFLVTDKEAAQVTSAGATALCFNVKAGQLGSMAAGHISGRTVWVGNAAAGSGDSSRPFSGGAITATPPSGSCTASAQYSLPVIYVPANTATPGTSARLFYCTAGMWTSGFSQETGGAANYTVWTTYPTPGNVVAPTATTDVSGKLFYSQVYVGSTTVSTGACILSGSGGATDSQIFALWDVKGNLLATSALAGAVGGTSLMSCQAWLAAITLPGPNSYFLGVQGNGTTAATYSTYKAGGAPTGYLTGAQTGGSFGTILPIATIPTSFTADVGPYMSLY